MKDQNIFGLKALLPIYRKINEERQFDIDCNEIFREEISNLKQWITREEISIDPKLLEALYKIVNTQIEELDKLNAMGTQIPSLTMSIIQMRALIMKIPTDLNLDNRARWSKNEQ